MSFQASAALRQVTGNVTEVSIHDEDWSNYSNDSRAILQIYMDEITLEGCNTVSRRLSVDSGHPGFKVFVSLAIAAYLSGRPVTVSYDTIHCEYYWNSFSLGVLQFARN